MSHWRPLVGITLSDCSKWIRIAEWWLLSQVKSMVYPLRTIIIRTTVILWVRAATMISEGINNSYVSKEVHLWQHISLRIRELASLRSIQPQFSRRTRNHRFRIMAAFIRISTWKQPIKQIIIKPRVPSRSPPLISTVKAEAGPKRISLEAAQASCRPLSTTNHSSGSTWKWNSNSNNNVQAVQEKTTNLTAVTTWWRSQITWMTMSNSWRLTSSLTQELPRMRCTHRPMVTCRLWPRRWSRTSMVWSTARRGSRISGNRHRSNHARKLTVLQETWLPIYKCTKIAKTRGKIYDRRSSLSWCIRKYRRLGWKPARARTRWKWQGSFQVRLSRLNWCTDSAKRLSLKQILRGNKR